MHILYERCAFVDVGQDIIAVAVWVPGEGPDGRKTIKRTLCARRSPICSGRWKGATSLFSSCLGAPFAARVVGCDAEPERGWWDAYSVRAVRLC
ncbi:hypothetical protein B6F55_12465 [Mycobacterium tuberculosis variant bovis]|nr:hypothetical protein B6F55_12465 [Mycobacterium tuberculosis variant bovis]